MSKEVPVLNNDNYKNWKHMMMAYLQVNGCSLILKLDEPLHPVVPETPEYDDDEGVQASQRATCEAAALTDPLDGLFPGRHCAHTPTFGMARPQMSTPRRRATQNVIR